jgi:hypothetical protein
MHSIMDPQLERRSSCRVWTQSRAWIGIGKTYIRETWRLPMRLPVDLSCHKSWEENKACKGRDWWAFAVC